MKYLYDEISSREYLIHLSDIFPQGRLRERMLLRGGVYSPPERRI
jgi:hypothetical protein